MLNENIRALRKAKGLSQEELAVRLNVVRQTVSKWEQGLSVPDADMLVAIGEVFDTPVGILLGETVTPPQPDELRTISEKLEVINLQFARRSAERRRALHILFIVLCVLTAAGFVCMMDPWVSVAAMGVTVGLVFLLEGVSVLFCGCISRTKL